LETSGSVYQWMSAVSII